MLLEPVQAILPLNLKQIIYSLPQGIKEGLEEIRIRKQRPLEICSRNHVFFVNQQAEVVKAPELAYQPTPEECKCLLELLTNHSLYSFEEELKRGFITIPGGHRIGFAGRTLLDGGEVKLVRDVGSFNIRIAREIRGVGEHVLTQLLDHDQAGDRIHHTLVISLPQQGKTTLLRDLARLMSYGDAHPLSGGFPRKSFKVGIVDERSEIAACVKGNPSFDLGPRTDVMDACPKAVGMMMMIRSMSPEVLIVDEIGRKEDVQAIQEARFAGISVIASAHGAHLDDIRRRPILLELIASCTFQRYVVIHRHANGQAQYSIFHADGRSVEFKQGDRLKRG